MSETVAKLTVNEIFLQQISYMRTRNFYWIATLGGLLVGVFLLAAINREGNPYLVETWAFWLILAGFSVVFGLTFWAARENKHKVKEQLPPLPTNLDVEALTKVQETLNASTVFKKMTRLDTGRTAALYGTVSLGLFLVNRVSSSTDLMPLPTALAYLVPIAVLTTISVAMHIIILKLQKHNFQNVPETSEPSVVASKDAQQQQ